MLSVLLEDSRKLLDINDALLVAFYLLQTAFSIFSEFIEGGGIRSGFSYSLFKSGFSSFGVSDDDELISPK